MQRFDHSRSAIWHFTVVLRTPNKQQRVSGTHWQFVQQQKLPDPSVQDPRQRPCTPTANTEVKAKASCLRTIAARRSSRSAALSARRRAAGAQTTHPTSEGRPSKPSRNAPSGMSLERTIISRSTKVLPPKQRRSTSSLFPDWTVTTIATWEPLIPPEQPTLRSSAKSILTS